MTRDRFAYRYPTPRGVLDHTDVREACASLAEMLDDMAMDPRCRALAITKLEEVSMWANKGIANAITNG